MTQAARLSWKTLAAVGGLAFVLRLGYLAAGPWRTGSALTPDSLEYVAEARNLAEHGVFSSAAQPPYVPDTVRTPLYPAFLALSCHGAVCPDLGVVLSGQAALGALAAMLCAACGWLLWGASGAAVLAGLFVAVDLGSIFHSALALSDVPFQAAFWLAFFVIACGLRLGLRRAPRALWGSAGLLIGVAALVRPIGLFYAPFAAAALWPSDAGDRRAWTRAAVWLAAFSCLAPALWATRNWVETGDWTVTSLPARDMARMRAAAVRSQLSGEPYAQAEGDVEAQMRAAHGGPFASVEEQARFAGRWGTRYVLAHPVAAGEVAAKDAARILGGHGLEIPCWQVYSDPSCDPLHPAPSTGGAGSGTRRMLRDHRAFWPLLGGYELFLVGLYVLAAAGSWRAWRDGQRAELALCASVIVYFLATSAGALAYHRFRLPLLPAVSLLAARGLAAYW